MAKSLAGQESFRSPVPNASLTSACSAEAAEHELAVVRSWWSYSTGSACLAPENPRLRKQLPSATLPPQPQLQLSLGHRGITARMGHNGCKWTPRQFQDRRTKGEVVHCIGPRYGHLK